MASQLFRITEDGTVDKLTGTAPTGDWSTASPVRADRYHATAYDNVDALTVFPDGRILFWDDDAWWLLSGEGARGLIRRLSANAAPAEVGAPPYRNLPLQTARFAVIGSEQQDTAIGPDGSVYFLSSPRHPGGANHWGIHRAKSGGGFVRFDYVDSDGETKEGARVASEDGRMLYDFDVRGRLMAWRGADDGQVRERFEYVGGLLSRIIDEGALGSGREYTTLTRDASGLLITAPYGEQTRVAFDGTDGSSWAETIRYPGDGADGAPRDDVDDAHVMLEIDDSSEARMNDRDGLLLAYTDRRGHLHRMEYDEFGRLLRDENVATGYRWTLEEAPVVVAPAVYEEGVTRVVTREVTLTGATGLSNVHRTIDSEDGVRVRELVSPDGTVTRTEELELPGSGDLRQLLSTPDGMESEVLFSVDPILGNVRPESVTYRRPSGAETQTRLEIEATRIEATRAPGAGGVGESERVERWITNVENPGFERVWARTVTRTDPDGVPDPLGTFSVEENLSPEGRSMRVLQDALGRPVLVTPAPGAAGLLPTRFTYDGAGRLHTVSRGTRTVTVGYTDGDVGEDDAGEEERAYARGLQDALGRWTRYRHDALGRRTRIDRVDGAALRMDHDADGRVTELELPGADGTGNTHVMTYGPDGRETEYEPPALSSSDPMEPPLLTPTTSTYGPARGQRGTTTLADGRTIRSTYDAGGRLQDVEVPFGTMTRSYAPLSHEVGVRDTGQVRRATMPQWSRLASLPGVGVSEVATEQDYDGRYMTERRTTGLLATGGTPLGGADGISVAHGYGSDAEFRLESLTVEGAVPIRYVHDDDGLLTSARVLTAADGTGGTRFVLQRDAANGLLDGMSMQVDGVPTGDSTEWQWSVYGEPTAIMHRWTDDTAPGGDALGWNLAYDDLGRVVARQEVQETDGAGGTVNWTMGHDAMGRLTDVFDGSGPMARYHYEYDAAGNRIGWDLPGSTCASGGPTSCADYDTQDRLVRYGAGADEVTYAYNAAGQQTERITGGAGGGETTTYEYDVFGGLRSVGLPGGSTGSGTRLDYALDAHGRRVGRYRDGVPTHFWVYQDSLNPVAQFDGDGNLELLFVYAGRGNVPSLMVTADGDVLRVLADQLGSVRRIVHVASYSGGIGDEGGVLTEGTGETWFEARYSPFGVIEEETARAGFDQPFRFAGGHWDAETQLIRFGARDYDPEVGRWTSKDPIRFDGGVNLYAYANNAPHMYVDPNGKNPLLIPVIVGLGAVVQSLIMDAQSAAIRGEEMNWGRSTGKAALKGVVAGALTYFFPAAAGASHTQIAARGAANGAVASVVVAGVWVPIEKHLNYLDSLPPPPEMSPIYPTHYDQDRGMCRPDEGVQMSHPGMFFGRPRHWYPYALFEDEL